MAKTLVSGAILAQICPVLPKNIIIWSFASATYDALLQASIIWNFKEN